MAHSTQPKQSTSSWQFLADFLMGGISGSVAKTVCAPIERVKLLIQTQHTNPKLAERPYTGIIDCFARVWREEGVAAYWRGNWANIVRYFPTTAINFAAKDSLQRAFVRGDPQKEKGKYFLGNLLAGGIAGSISLTFVYPLDFARTRMGADVGRALHERQFKSLTHCCQSIYRSDGVSGLYKGFGISVLGIFIYRALYFGCYDTGKKWMYPDEEAMKKSSFFLKWIFAQAVTTTSETMAFPIDTVRRRLMMQSGREYAAKLEQERLAKLEQANKQNSTGEASAKTTGKPKSSSMNSEFVVKYKGTGDCFRKILAEEGINGFFKGNLSNIWRSIGSSLVLVLYDEL